MEDKEKLAVEAENGIDENEGAVATLDDADGDSAEDRDWARHATNIEIRPELSLVGVKKRLDSSDGGDNYEKVLAFFDECANNGTLSKLRDMASPDWKCYFGVCTNFGKKDYDFWITVAVERGEDEKIEPPEGMDTLFSEEGEFAIFSAKGAMPSSISSCWKGIYNDWFTHHEYAHLDKPEIEQYPFGDMRSEDYEAEVWVPVKLMPERKPPNRKNSMITFFGMILGLTAGAVIGSSLGNITVGVIVGALAGALVTTGIKKRNEAKEDTKNKD